MNRFCHSGKKKMEVDRLFIDRLVTIYVSKVKKERRPMCETLGRLLPTSMEDSSFLILSKQYSEINCNFG